MILGSLSIGQRFSTVPGGIIWEVVAFVPTGVRCRSVVWRTTRIFPLSLTVFQ